LGRQVSVVQGWRARLELHNICAKVVARDELGGRCLWGDSVPNKWLDGLKCHDSSYKNKTPDLSLGNQIRMEVIKKTMVYRR